LKLASGERAGFFGKGHAGATSPCARGQFQTTKYLKQKQSILFFYYTYHFRMPSRLFKVEDRQGLFHRFSLQEPITVGDVSTGASRWEATFSALLVKDPEDGVWTVLNEETLRRVLSVNVSHHAEFPIVCKFAPTQTPPWPDAYTDSFQLIKVHMAKATARLVDPKFFRGRAERTRYNEQLRSNLISNLGIESFVRRKEGSAATVVVREALYRSDVLAETVGGTTVTLERVDYQLEDGWPFSIPCYLWRPNESPDGSRSASVRRPALIYMGDGPKYFFNDYNGSTVYTEAMMLQAELLISLRRSARTHL
jgi:hypothetical protein